MTIYDLSGSDPVNSIKDVTDKSRIISMLFVAVYMVVSLPYPATYVSLGLVLILRILSQSQDSGGDQENI